jgi:nucleoside-diphosphate-sugar epimerase
MKDVLVLGGSGYLGRALVRRLVERGHRPFVVVRSRQSAAKVVAASADAVVLREEEVKRRSYECVVNLIVDYGRTGSELSDLVATNLLYPLRIIERTDWQAIVNVSTALPGSYSRYAFTKKLLEGALMRLAQERQRRCFNVHLHNMYGPGSDGSNFVTFLIAKMLASEELSLSLCENSRDFIYIDDVSACLELLASNPGTVEPGTVEVGSGQAVELRHLALMLKEMTGSNSHIDFGARAGNPEEPSILVADTEKLCRIGWTPAYSLDRGLQETIDWVRDSRSRTIGVATPSSPAGGVVEKDQV